MISQFALFPPYSLPILRLLTTKDTQLIFGLFNHLEIRLLSSSALAIDVAIIFECNAPERWIFRDRTQKGLGSYALPWAEGDAVSPIIVVTTVNAFAPLFGNSSCLSNTIGIAAGQRGTGHGTPWSSGLRRNGWAPSRLLVFPADRRFRTSQWTTDR